MTDPLSIPVSGEQHDEPRCYETGVCARLLALEAALTEIAANRHGLRRPAGAIARAALNGEELPGWMTR